MSAGAQAEAAGANATPGRRRRRSASRLAAVQALYQIELADAQAQDVIEEYVAHRLGARLDGETYGEADAAFFRDLVRGTTERFAEVDELLRTALTGGRLLARLEAILRALLRAGTYELLVMTDVPARAVINEYLNVAHAFFGGSEPRLVNGVLDGLARRLRPGESQ